MEFKKTLNNHGEIIEFCEIFKLETTSSLKTICMVYKHAYFNTLLLLHSAFMPSVVKMPLNREVGDCALSSHGNYIC